MHSLSTEENYMLVHANGWILQQKKKIKQKKTPKQQRTNANVNVWKWGQMLNLVVFAVLEWYNFEHIRKKESQQPKADCCSSEQFVGLTFFIVHHL